ncbi:dicarboxylate/amino acid:cation symporter [Candidatus Riflebacteria bacterium]
MEVWKKILIGMVAGIFIGYLFGEHSPIPFFHGAIGATFISFINIIGEIFLKLLKMIVVPLIFFSLCIGVASMDDVSAIGSAGIKILIYFMGTTAFAIIIGLAFALVVQPGKYIEGATKDKLLAENKSVTTKYKQKAGLIDETGKKGKKVDNRIVANLKRSVNMLKISLLEMIPRNPVESMADTKVLQIIFFSMLFGIGITSLKGEKYKVMMNFCHSVNDIMVFLVNLVMEMAPFGVCTLMASTVSKIGLSVMAALLIYALTVVAGLMCHLFLVYMPVVYYTSGRTPKDFLIKLKEALILAFSTSSSSATLPVTMRVVEKNLGIPNKTTSFVLPLGATVNMDGTALYQGVAVVFIAQVFGYHLSPGDLLSTVLMATMASVGAAGVPGAGMITLVMVLDTVNPLLVGGIALVMGVDRFLDMVRTAVNVAGDSTACLFMEYLNKKPETPAPQPDNAAQVTV